MLALFNNILVANTAEDITQTIQAYVGPFLLLVIGIVAFTFLFQRQIMQFVLFLIIAIVVAILFYAPGVVKSIAQSFVGDTDINQGDSGW